MAPNFTNFPKAALKPRVRQIRYVRSKLFLHRRTEIAPDHLNAIAASKKRHIVYSMGIRRMMILLRAGIQIWVSRGAISDGRARAGGPGQKFLRPDRASGGPGYRVEKFGRAGMRQLARPDPPGPARVWPDINVA